MQVLPVSLPFEQFTPVILSEGAVSREPFLLVGAKISLVYAPLPDRPPFRAITAYSQVLVIDP